MYLSQIVKCISLKLQNVFVSNCKMYFSQIVKMSQIVKLSTCCLLSATIWQSVQVKQPLSPPIAAPFTSGSETLPRLNFQSPPFHLDQVSRTRPSDQDIRTKTLGPTSGSFCETQPPASIGWVALSSVVVCPASVTPPLISTIRCFRPYKPYIFCEDMILVTCQCHSLLSWAQFTGV